jgi:hypothetical protein
MAITTIDTTETRGLGRVERALCEARLDWALDDGWDSFDRLVTAWEGVLLGVVRQVYSRTTEPLPAAVEVRSGVRTVRPDSGVQECGEESLG